MAVKETIIIDDDVLVRQCCKGDRMAMEVLITKHQDKIYNIILKICQNQHDALELTQDTFVKILENIGSFKGSSRLYTWIYRIAVNLTLNYCKKRVKIGFASLDSSVGRDEQAVIRLKDFLMADRSQEPTNIAEDKELGRLVTQAMDRLPDEQRMIIILRDIEGLSYTEISEIMELELGTVKSRLSRAREALKELVESVI